MIFLILHRLRADWQTGQSTEFSLTLGESYYAAMAPAQLSVQQILNQIPLMSFRYGTDYYLLGEPFVRAHPARADPQSHDPTRATNIG